MADNELFKAAYARDLLLSLIDEDEDAEGYAFWEYCPDNECMHQCETLGYDWYSGGWYTPETIEAMKAAGGGK